LIESRKEIALPEALLAQGFFFSRLLKFTQPSTLAEQREKMASSPDEQ
jgi:hypothetical protein